MTRRLRIALALFFFAFCLIITRLFYWQVVKADELSSLGEAQYGNTMRIASERGEIRTSDGFPIVANKLSYLLFANPKAIIQKNSVATTLSSMLELDIASVSAALSKDKFWVPIKQHIDTDTKVALEKLTIDGIGFEQEYKRFYPEASMAANLLGFVGKNEIGEDKGYFGLEGYYDRQLRGKTGTVLEIHDAFGRPILSKKNGNTKEAPGRSLILGIDRAIQFIVERKLSDSIQKYTASGGMVGIIDPHTGNMLAMASYPSFDPRTYTEYVDNLYKNPFITNTYEPGSTFKSLVMAAGLDARVVRPDTKCPICSKPIQIGEYQIHTWNDQYRNNITMADVIQHSDNTGMVYVARRLGLDRLLAYLHEFGIGELTGIDLQGEVAPFIRPKEQWYPIDVATAGFGQGISVTSIALLDAFASIANNGVRMEPHVVSEIETPDGERIKIPPKILSKPISSETAKVMTEILVNAVNKGEAKWVKLKGYRIAGKTGTAQIPIAGHYDPNKTIASFIGFAPADNPKFAMLVVIDRPTTSIYGAETAAPVFMDIAKDLFAYYNISPTE